jgi:hypothetical protein
VLLTPHADLKCSTDARAHEETERPDICSSNRKLKLARADVAASETTDANKQDTLAFIKACFTNGLGVDRVIHYTWIVKKLGGKTSTEVSGPPRKKTSSESWPTSKGGGFLYVRSKRDYRITLQELFRWLSARGTIQHR